MKTPKEYRDNLLNHIITKQMLVDCLYSVNKRAKNYRDKEREQRAYSRCHRYVDNSAFIEGAREKKLEMYMHYKKESVGIFQRFYCNIYILSSINRITFRTNCTLTKSLTLCPVVSNSLISIMGKEYLSNSSFLIGV